MKDIFMSFDRNNDGLLSRDELIEGYTSIYGTPERAEMEVDRILSQVDTNNNGLIDYSEFLVANTRIDDYLSTEKLRAAFTLFDADGNDRITVEEIQYMLGCSEDMTEELWTALLGDVDKDGDKEISFEEFKKMMLALAERRYTKAAF